MMDEEGVGVVGIEIRDDIYERFQELCNELNLDALTRENTWQTFASVRQRYSLEGDAAHWLCCAVYVACRQATIPSMHMGVNVFHGNYVSLTRLLRCCGLSLVEFFDKSRKWGDMTNMNQDFRNKIERLERNFAVTTVIFKKFEPLFEEIFKDFSRNSVNEARPHRKRLSSKSIMDLFEFCWTLFLCVKSSLRISDDLVNSYHLLLACVDLVFVNVVHANRKTEITAAFAGFAETGPVDQKGEPICIINTLCSIFDGIPVEAKTIKEFWLKPKIKSMIELHVLKGDPDTLTGLIDESYFENNYKKLEKEYEEYVLTEGDFDERMYLSSERQSEIGMPSSGDTYKSVEKQINRTYPPLEELRHIMPATPLSGKRYLPDRRNAPGSPVSVAVLSVSRLQALLSGRKAEATDSLKEMLVGCPRNPIPGIEELLNKLSDVFIAGYVEKFRKKDQAGFYKEFAHYRTQLAQTLYYRLLENIIKAEKIDKGDLNEILEDEYFNKSLFGVSLEIVLFSYNSQLKFPWILNVLSLHGWHFLKPIELVVRSEENLSRDIVKHLSQCEERIFEEFAWNAESPLWEAVAEGTEIVPSCEDVFLPSQMGKAPEQDATPTNRYAVIRTSQGEQRVPVATSASVESTLIIQDKNKGGVLGVVIPSKHNEKAKRNNSVALFFRKFYYISYVRLKDLCKNLSVDEELVQKIWTCFELAVAKNVQQLMKSRHMDQIIMCCVYIACKVSGKQKSFQDIMHCYRLQPQFDSRVYRHVLIKPPNMYGDLIKFYNTTFVESMQKHTSAFAGSNSAQGSDAPPLSPMPQLKCSTPMSPIQRMANKHSVYVRALKAPKTPSPAKQFKFGSNHSNGLKEINRLVEMATAAKPKAVKRILSGDDSGQPPSKIFAQKLATLMDERQSTVPSSTAVGKPESESGEDK